MTKQNNNTYYLVVSSIIFTIIVLLGSFVVSFNVLDCIYLTFFCSFLIVYKINSRSRKR